MFLSKQELIDFTGYKRTSKQIDALKAFGVPFKVGINGKPIILKSEVEKFLGGDPKNNDITEPNWTVLID